MIINNNIKLVRTEKRIMQEDLARAVNCTPKTMRRYESGDRSPSIEMALRIAAYLKVGLGDLFYIEYEERDDHGQTI